MPSDGAHFKRVTQDLNAQNYRTDPALAGGSEAAYRSMIAAVWQCSGLGNPSGGCQRPKGLNSAQDA